MVYTQLGGYSTFCDDLDLEKFIRTPQNEARKDGYWSVADGLSVDRR